MTGRPLTLLVLFFNICFCVEGRVWSQSASGDTTNREKLRITAVVLDAHGTPIRDLHTDDFSMTIAGKEQPAQMQPLPFGNPNTVGTTGLVIVVVDAMHTVWLEEKDLRLNAGKYLAAYAQRNMPVSLLLFSRKGVLTPVHEYTTDSKTLTAALDQADAAMHHKAPTADASTEVAVEAQRLVEFYRGGEKFASQRAMEQYPGAILGGITQVAQSVAAIPGRKSLIWISSTYPFAVDEKRGKILSPTTRSLTAGDLIYPRLLTEDQVRQLQIVWKNTIHAAQSSGLAIYPVQTRTNATIPLNPEVINSMVSMAHMTGGVEVHSVGDFFPQFLDLGEQSRAAYELDVPPDAVRDCKSEWCPMRISVKRAGARVLAPQGFFRDTVPPEQSPLVPKAAETAALEAIPFSVTWKPTKDTGPKRKIAFIVAFGPTAGIPGAGSSDLNLEVMVHAFADGTDKQSIAFGAETHLPQTKLDEVHTKGFVLNNAIELEPGEYSVRFVVHDKISGRVGVLFLPLKVASSV